MSKMRSVRVVEWFRPLVGAQKWDYIVLWKLGNDPSRFIEWMGCCCCGGNGDFVKQEKTGKSICRDISFKHSVRTKACESLSNLPASMDLYSGVHSEVVISKQPIWLNQVDDSESVASHDGVGTRVFVPVAGGLIELYSSKNIPKDQKVLDLVVAHCKMISLEQEATNPSEVLSPDSQPEICTTKFRSSLCSVFSPSLKSLPPMSQSCLNSSIEGLMSIDSSVLKNPTNQILFDSNIEHKSQHESSSGSKNDEYDEEFSRRKDGEKSAKRALRRKEKGDYQSKNLLAERERRRRIKNGLLTLRSLVPKISKMDMASILGDAVKYIRDLQMEEMELRGELNEMEQQDCQKSKERLRISGLDDAKRRDSCSILVDKTSDSSTFGPEKQPEIKVEVNQIGERKFLLKLFAAHKRGGFVRLLEVMDSLNLKVISTNSTAFNGRVQNILEVKADKDIEPKKLRDFFIGLRS